MSGSIHDDIINRKKQGFGVPVHEWLFTRLGNQIHRELKAFCADPGFFAFGGIEQLMNSSSKVRVWYLYNFALWPRCFIEGQMVEEMQEAQSR